MNIYKVNKILSSESKHKILTHLWDCNCNSHTVNNLCEKFKLSQPNTSKHIKELLHIGAIEFIQKKQNRYYKISNKWREKWREVITPQLVFNKGYKCSCSLNK